MNYVCRPLGWIEINEQLFWFIHVSEKAFYREAAIYGAPPSAQAPVE